DYATVTLERILSGAFVAGADYINATRLRLKLANSLNSIFEDVDVAVTASALDIAHRIDDTETRDRNHGRHAWSPFSMSGGPALSIPIGFSKNGLPIGMQIVGKPH